MGKIQPPQYYLSDLRLADMKALDRIARDPDFFYAYLNENRKPVWRGVVRFMRLSLWTRLRRPRHWFKAVRSCHDRQMIGCVVMLDLHVRERGLAEIAYFIAAPAQGRGIGGNAVISAVRWAYANHGLRRLDAHADPDNPASTSILMRLGLQPAQYIPPSRSMAFDRDGNPRPRYLWAGPAESLAAALARHPQEHDFPVLDNP